MDAVDVVDCGGHSRTICVWCKVLFLESRVALGLEGC